MPKHYQVFQNGQDPGNEDNMVHAQTGGKAAGDDEATFQTHVRAFTNTCLIQDNDRQGHVWQHWCHLWWEHVDTPRKVEGHLHPVDSFFLISGRGETVFSSMDFDVFYGCTPFKEERMNIWNLLHQFVTGKYGTLMQVCLCSLLLLSHWTCKTAICLYLRYVMCFLSSPS